MEEGCVWPHGAVKLLLLPADGAWGSVCQGPLVRLLLLYHVKRSSVDRSPVSLDYVNRLPSVLRGLVVQAALWAGVGAPLGLLTAVSVCRPQNVRIDPNSLSFGMWKEIPVPFYLSVYFFDIVNPQEILEGKKPQVRERGPYVYRYGQSWPGRGRGLRADGAGDGGMLP